MVGNKSLVGHVKGHMKKEPYIFLSYAREDGSRVQSLYQNLSDAGFTPWMDKKDIIPGEKWKARIRKAIRGSQVFLACLSRNSVSKRGCFQWEIQEALDIWREKLESDIYIVPVRLEDCEVPDSLSDFQWVDLFAENGWAQLIKAIRVGMEQQREASKLSVYEVRGPNRARWKTIRIGLESDDRINPIPIPILGPVGAGEAYVVDYQDVLEYILFPPQLSTSALISGHSYCAFRVQENSMVPNDVNQPGIASGSLVIGLHPQHEYMGFESVHDRDIVVTKWPDGRILLRQYCEDGSRIGLVPFNRKKSPIDFQYRKRDGELRFVQLNGGDNPTDLQDGIVEIITKVEVVIPEDISQRWTQCEMID